MKILFLVSSLPINKIGGTEIITLRICDKIAINTEHEPYIYTIPQNGSEGVKEVLSTLFSRFDVQKFPVENILLSSRTNSTKPLAFTMATMSYTQELTGIIRKLEPDVIVSMKALPELFITRVSRIAKKEGIPLVLMVRGFSDLIYGAGMDDYNEQVSNITRMKDRFFYGSLLPAYMKNLSLIILQSETQRGILKERFGLNGRVLPNPIDVEYIQSCCSGNNQEAAHTGKNQELSDQKNELLGNRKNLLNDDTFNMIYVGSISKKKNVETLIRAMDLLVRKEEREAPESDADEIKEKRFRLFLVGGGADAERITNLISRLELEDHVILMGKMEQEELWRFSAKCDAFVFPSLTEGFPNAIMEAMACGLPVITSNFSGVENILQSKSNGLIFKKKDFRELAGMIQRISTDEKYRKEVGDYNREFVKRFTWERFIKGFETILEEIGKI